MDRAASFMQTSVSRRKHQCLHATRISPIYKLNPDLLGYIIYLCSAEDGNPVHYSRRILQNAARFSAQVDKRWRLLSLQNKATWLGPVLDWFSPPKWVAEVLRRSEPLPLDVIIPFDAANMSPLVVSMALFHLSRIRRLELTLMDNTWWYITQSNQLRTQAPMLQKLILDIRSGNELKRRFHNVGPVSMFGGHAPRLQHLQVRNCSLNLTQLASSALRVLVIEDVHCIPISELLNTLRQMKCLESLQLVLPVEHPAIQNDNVYLPSAFLSDVHLLNLVELKVSASLSTCAKLLHSLVLPTTCDLVIDAQHTHRYQDGQDLVTIISCFESVLGNWACEPLVGRQYLHLGMDEVGFSVDAPKDDITSHPFLSLTFWWEHISQVEMLFAFLPLLTSLFSRSSKLPDNLSIMVSRDVPPELYPDLRSLLIPWLKATKYIQAIEFQSHNAFAIMEKLFLGPRLDILLPHLSDMTFVEVDFTTQKRRYWRRLLKILKFRGSDRVDAPILQLDFIHCVGDFRRENLGGRFGTMVKINGRDISSDDDEVDEASDYTVQDLSD